jgi:hypothetical protein
MRHRGPLVAAAWGAGNIALACVLAGFGAKPVVLALWFSAAGLVELFAAAAWLGQRRRAGRGTWQAAPSGDSVALVALAVLIIGLAWVFYWQLAPIAAIPLFFAAKREMASWRGGA